MIYKREYLIVLDNKIRITRIVLTIRVYYQLFNLKRALIKFNTSYILQLRTVQQYVLMYGYIVWIHTSIYTSIDTVK